MTNILITNSLENHTVTTELNKGGAAVSIATVEVLRQHLPDARFASFVQFSPAFADSLGTRVIAGKRYSMTRYSVGTMLDSSLDVIRCLLWARTHRRCPRFARAMVNSRRLREFAGADVVVHLGTDTYSDDYGILGVIEHSKDILLGVILGKPVVIWAESIGPFGPHLTSRLAKFTLDRVALITVREEPSFGILGELGVSRPPMYLTADPAFLLKPASRARAQEILAAHGVSASDRPLVGLTIGWTTLTVGDAKQSRRLRYMKESYWMIRAIIPEGLFRLMLRGAGRFKKLSMSGYVNMEEIIQVMDGIVEQLSATVVLIPHDYNPGADDRALLEQVAQRTRHPDHVKVISGDYSAPELKAVIGECDLLVAGKMHANIAALSMHVPVVAIAYSHKFRGIMQTVGQEHYVCDKLDAKAILSMVLKAWGSREETKDQLRASVTAVKGRAIRNAELVAEILAQKRVSGAGA